MTGAACSHTNTRRGRNIPRVWGSWQSRVCTDCGDYRAVDHHGKVAPGIIGVWRSAEFYEEDTAEPEDE